MVLYLNQELHGNRYKYSFLYILLPLKDGIGKTSCYRSSGADVKRNKKSVFGEVFKNSFTCQIEDMTLLVYKTRNNSRKS